MQAQVQNAKLQLRGSPLQHFSTPPSLPPARPPGASLLSAALHLASAGGSSSLLIVHQGWTRLHPGSWGRWIRSLAYLFISVLRLGISKHEPLPISSARDKTGHDKPI